MLSEIWGAYAWKFFHLVTLDYPINPTQLDKYHYYQFFNSIQYVLPCGTCRKNLTEHLKNYPLTDNVLASRTSLIKWMIDLHNVVNYYIGKPMLTYQEAMNAINNFKPKKKSNTLYYIIIIILIIIIAVLIYYLVRRKKID